MMGATGDLNVVLLALAVFVAIALQFPPVAGRRPQRNRHSELALPLASAPLQRARGSNRQRRHAPHQVLLVLPFAPRTLTG